MVVKWLSATRPDLPPTDGICRSELYSASIDLAGGPHHLAWCPRRPDGYTVSIFSSGFPTTIHRFSVRKCVREITPWLGIYTFDRDYHPERLCLGDGVSAEIRFEPGLRADCDLSHRPGAFRRRFENFFPVPVAYRVMHRWLHSAAFARDGRSLWFWRLVPVTTVRGLP